MTISATVQPDNIALAGNPIGYKLNTDNLYSVAGDQERITLTINPSTTPVDGETIIIEWSGQAPMTFTAKDAPDDSGYQIPTNNGLTLTDEEYANLLAFYFQQNYYLYQAFEIYVFTASGSWGVNIKYKTNKSISAVVTNTLTDIVDSISPGVDAVSNDTSIVVKLMVADDAGSGAYDEIAEVEYRPDESGDVSFDLAELIRARLSLALPGYGTLDPYVAPFGWCRSFFIRHVEKTGQVYLGMVATATRFAILSGLEWDKFLDYDVDDIHKNGSASYKFATWQPRQKMIAETGKDWLYIFNYLTITVGSFNVQLKADITYKDGTQALDQDIQAAFTSEQYDLIVIPSGPGQLTLPASGTPNNPISKYTLRLWNVDTNLALSEDFTYIIDRAYYEYNRTFLFKNSVGVYEVVWCHGFEEIAAAVTRQTAIQNVPFNYTSADVESYQYDHTNEKIYTANTGTKRRVYIEYLLDLLQSDEVYIFGPDPGDGGHWLPVKILTDKVSIRKYATINNSLEFNWTYRFTNTNIDGL